MTQRCIVIGPNPVFDRRRGEAVYLDDAHAERLVRSGHVRIEPEAPPAPDEEPQRSEPQQEPDPPQPQASRRRKPAGASRTPVEPRGESSGLSHAQAAPAEAPTEMKEQADGG